MNHMTEAYDWRGRNADRQDGEKIGKVAHVHSGEELAPAGTGA